MQHKPFENTVGKGEIALKEQFLLFQVFSTRLETFMPFSSNLKLFSANSFYLEKSKICRFGLVGCIGVTETQTARQIEREGQSARQRGTERERERGGGKRG